MNETSTTKWFGEWQWWMVPGWWTTTTTTKPTILESKSQKTKTQPMISTFQTIFAVIERCKFNWRSNPFCDNDYTPRFFVLFCFGVFFFSELFEGWLKICRDEEEWGRRWIKEKKIICWWFTIRYNRPTWSNGFICQKIKWLNYKII
jgi:hypothetical protein